MIQSLSHLSHLENFVKTNVKNLKVCCQLMMYVIGIFSLNLLLVMATYGAILGSFVSLRDIPPAEGIVRYAALAMLLLMIPVWVGAAWVTIGLGREIRRLFSPTT
jgi:hypothetical protein